MTDLVGETSLESLAATIGPLSTSEITDEPVAWGLRDRFLVSDEATERRVEIELAQRRRRARLAFFEELRPFLTDLRQGSAPSTVLHALIAWGPVTPERVAGYIGLPYRPVRSRLGLYELIGIASRRVVGLGEGETMEMFTLGESFDPSFLEPSE